MIGTDPLSQMLMLSNPTQQVGANNQLVRLQMEQDRRNKLEQARAAMAQRQAAQMATGDELERKKEMIRQNMLESLAQRNLSSIQGGGNLPSADLQGILTKAADARRADAGVWGPGGRRFVAPPAAPASPQRPTLAQKRAFLRGMVPEEAQFAQGGDLVSFINHMKDAGYDGSKFGKYRPGADLGRAGHVARGDTGIITLIGTGLKQEAEPLSAEEMASRRAAAQERHAKTVAERRARADQRRAAQAQPRQQGGMDQLSMALLSRTPPNQLPNMLHALAAMRQATAGPQLDPNTLAQIQAQREIADRQSGLDLADLMMRKDERAAGAAGAKADQDLKRRELLVNALATPNLDPNVRNAITSILGEGGAATAIPAPQGLSAVERESLESVFGRDQTAWNPFQRGTPDQFVKSVQANRETSHLTRQQILDWLNTHQSNDLLWNYWD